MPKKYKQSSFGKAAHAILEPAEALASSYIYKNPAIVANLVEIDAARMNSLLDSVDRSNKKAVILFYNHNEFFSRYLLQDINDLAGIYQGSTLFLLIAFDDDKDSVQYLLKDAGTLNFRPIIASVANLKTASHNLQKYNIGMSDTPVVIFKSNTNSYENLPADMSARKLIIAKLGQK